MSEFLSSLGLEGFLTAERTLDIVRAVLTLVVGVILALAISRAIGRAVASRAGRQGTMLIRRLIFSVLLALVLATTLHQLGFRLSVLLGAAGVLTVAVGFASQTSASNLVSGLFLIVERPFVVGDVIQVEGVTGEVLSIDLLSVKIRTFDNLYVRVPNETIIKSRVTNLTHFPIRRIDLQIGVAYKEDLDREPLFIFKGFGESSIDMQFSVWGTRENYLTLRNVIQEEIKAAFDAEGIEIPFPHRTLYAGSATDPIPIRVVERGGNART
jgi:small-conductance mechanosensitive channel